MYQVLAEHLDLSYTPNMSALLPKSVRVSTRICAFLFKHQKKQSTFENYYGKTQGFSAPSEANFLWNQWVAPDASRFRTVLSAAGASDVANYYSFLSECTGKPTLAKNNNANVFADKIADSLENSYFICLRRDPVYLAQSLIRARLEINGNLNQSYGVVDVDNMHDGEDPYQEVVEQVAYMNSLAEQQQSRIGEDRFWIVDYEEFCANPATLVNRIRTKILKQCPTTKRISGFPDTNKVADEKVFNLVVAATKTHKASSINRSKTRGIEPSQCEGTKTIPWSSTFSPAENFRGT